MIYTLCEFEYGYTGTFYQQSGSEGLIGFFDMDGNPLILNPPYGYHVIDNNPPLPSWAIQN